MFLRVRERKRKKQGDPDDPSNAFSPRQSGRVALEIYTYTILMLSLGISIPKRTGELVYLTTTYLMQRDPKVASCRNGSCLNPVTVAVAAVQGERVACSVKRIGSISSCLFPPLVTRVGFFLLACY